MSKRNKQLEKMSQVAIRVTHADLEAVIVKYYFAKRALFIWGNQAQLLNTLIPFEIKRVLDEIIARISSRVNRWRRLFWNQPKFSWEKMALLNSNISILQYEERPSRKHLRNLQFWLNQRIKTQKQTKLQTLLELLCKWLQSSKNNSLCSSLFTSEERDCIISSSIHTNSRKRVEKKITLLRRTFQVARKGIKVKQKRFGLTLTMGIGKSWIVRDAARVIAKKLGKEIDEDNLTKGSLKHINDPEYFLLVDKRLSQCDPSDLRGILGQDLNVPLSTLLWEIRWKKQRNLILQGSLMEKPTLLLLNLKIQRAIHTINQQSMLTTIIEKSLSGVSRLQNLETLVIGNLGNLDMLILMNGKLEDIKCKDCWKKLVRILGLRNYMQGFSLNGVDNERKELNIARKIWKLFPRLENSIGKERTSLSLNPSGIKREMLRYGYLQVTFQEKAMGSFSLTR